ALLPRTIRSAAESGGSAGFTCCGSANPRSANSTSHHRTGERLARGIAPAQPDRGALTMALRLRSKRVGWLKAALAIAFLNFVVGTSLYLTSAGFEDDMRRLLI